MDFDAALKPVELALADWIIIGYCVLAVGIGVYFSRRASRNLGEFFLSGRSLPWWIAWAIFDYLTGRTTSFAMRMTSMVLVSVGAWWLVTVLTAPVDNRRLLQFVDRVRPPARFWKPITSQFPDYRGRIHLGMGLLQWALGVAFVYLFTFGLGKVLLGEPGRGGLMLALSAPCAVAVMVFVRRGGEEPAPSEAVERGQDG